MIVGWSLSEFAKGCLCMVIQKADTKKNKFYKNLKDMMVSVSQNDTEVRAEESRIRRTYIQVVGS